MNRYISSLTITLLLYSSLAAAFLYSYDKPTAINSKALKSEQNVKFTIISQQKPQPKKEKPKKIEKKEPIKKEIKKKKVEKKPKKIKKPTPKKVEKKEPVKKEIKKKPKKKVEPKKKKEQKQISQIKQNRSKTKSISNLEEKNILKEKQDHYFKKIKETIAKNKNYPKVAVRRGIQGEVSVKFCISTTGELLSFDILKGKKIFHKSVKKAIEKSFPISAPQGVLT
ncbi:MAG: energy transducer TonB, partial [Campylobacterota bacterium]|nr:energy transducer TonB [Campylobacterota bacterium]